MVSLLKSIALESLGYLGITLTVGLACHSQVHAYLAALTIEVGTQVINHLLADTLGLAVANLMNGSVGQICIFLQFREF